MIQIVKNELQNIGMGRESIGQCRGAIFAHVIMIKFLFSEESLNVF